MESREYRGTWRKPSGFTHFCLVASRTMTYSSKGSKIRTFSLACGLRAGEEVCAHLTMKKTKQRGDITYELYESLGHVFLDVRSKRDERALMLSHCAKAKQNMGHSVI